METDWDIFSIHGLLLGRAGHGQYLTKEVWLAMPGSPSKKLPSQFKYSYFVDKFSCECVRFQSALVWCWVNLLQHVLCLHVYTKRWSFIFIFTTIIPCKCYFCWAEKRMLSLLTVLLILLIPPQNKSENIHWVPFSSYHKTFLMLCCGNTPHISEGSIFRILLFAYL